MSEHRPSPRSARTFVRAFWSSALWLTVLGSASIASAARAAQDPPPPPASTPTELVVRWKGTSYRGPDIAASVGALASAAAVEWASWATEHGYVLDIDNERRVLFVHSRQSSGSSALTALDRVLDVLDAIAPQPAGAAPALPTVIECAKPADLASLMAALGARHEYLAKWSKSAAQQVGFALEQPFAAAYLTKSAELKEYNPRNELVHRSAELFLLARYGRLPFWLSSGLAWHVEVTVCGAIWCFPFRSSFVARKEHKSWDEGLGDAMSARDGRALTIQDLTGLARGTFDSDRALLAWGAASFLAKHRKAELPKLLAALCAEHTKGRRVTHPDGTWELAANYEVPDEKQLELLLAACGPKVFAEMSEFCSR